MNEQIRVGKTFVCECGKSFAFDLATEASIESISVTVNCPKCGSSHYLNGETLLKNFGKTAGSVHSPSGLTSSSSGSAMGMFDVPESAVDESLSASSEEESYVPLMELFDK